VINYKHAEECCASSCCEDSHSSIPFSNDKKPECCKTLVNPFFGTCCCHGFLAADFISIDIHHNTQLLITDYILNNPADIPIPFWQPPKLTA
jgi:hypothetical protein